MASFFPKTLPYLPLLWGLPASVLAQTPPEPAALPSITVTASKQDTDAFDTPASVSIIDGATLERDGVTHLDEVAQTLPNVYLSDFSGGPATITIRGMGYGDEESDATSIGVQLDGVSLPLTSLAANLFDLDHIEVLRGPQSLMHGPGNIGGLIAMKSRDPDNSFGGQVEAEYGTYGKRRASAALDIPLAEKTAIRITAGHAESNGYVNNSTLGSKDSTGWHSNHARIKLLHKDESGGELRLGLHHLNRNGGNDFFLAEAQAGERESHASDAGTNDIDYTLFSGEYTRPVGNNLRMTISAGASDAKWSYWTPTSLFGAVNGFDIKTRNYQAEARLLRQASAGSPYDWVAGLNATRVDLDRPYLYDYVPYFRSATSSQVDGTVLAAFGEAGWHFSPAWRIAAGVRLTHDYRKLDWSSDQNGAVQSLNNKVTDSVWLPQLTLEYRPDEQQFAWARLARGYKSSGFNIFATQSIAAGDPYAPEYANYAEAGYRVRAVDDSWSLGAVAFYARLRDQQVIIEGLGGATMTDNAGRSHTHGLELEATVRPLRTLDLHAYLGYTKAVYDEYLRGSTDYAGQQFSATPRTTMGLSVAWRPAQDWELNLSARRIGTVYLQTNHQRDDAYTLLDASLAWYRKNWTLGIYGQNLGNAKYLTRAISDGIGGILVASGAPRTVGARVSYAF